MSAFHHIPIMAAEVMALLRPERGGIFVDGTLGGGGHAALILERLPASGRYYGIDRDAEAIAAASKRLADFENFTALRGNFFDMSTLLGGVGVTGADGILLDLGVSSYQIDAPERGFSYKEDAPLDMRMDASQALCAADVVNTYSFEALCHILRDYGEERFAARIADAIIKAREDKPIARTAQLADIVSGAIPAKARRAEKQHPARRTFQGLRIEVNGELEGLEQALQAAHDLLNTGGVLAVITFHSLEDRIVKHTFKRFEDPCICDKKAPICTCGRKPTAKVLTRKPITAGDAELSENARAHSAKLRAIEKLPQLADA
ncbi:MAG: 16S rRNA (cytosine(1402)-N(4))-methyltransferase RsmH [Eubacteriales bacterium]|nr:16S rRNA (cytosine(1402)-N(4))-methyltransferase RsmH [Eubacteriales bacterium]